MLDISSKINPNKIFTVQHSELQDRWDADMVLYNKIIHNFKYKSVFLKDLLSKNPQYGANESGIERTSLREPRYIRITDIDEYGMLKNELGATAQNIEERFILENNDILFARSGNTVGKAYIHKEKNVDYECFFAGYMIRFVLDKNKVLPDYVFTYTQLNIYKNWVKAVQRTAGQPNINAEEYKSLKIPLPTVEIQMEIVSIIQKAYQQKHKKEAEAKALLKSVDYYLLAELGITKPERKSSLSDRIFITDFSTITGKRLDPLPYDTNTKELKNAIINVDPQYFCILSLRSFILQSMAGDWGVDEKDDDGDIEFVKCLVIRATEFNNEYNLNLDNSRVKYRLINKNKFDKIDVQPNDLLIEKSGGSVDQPVGRVALITKDIFEENNLFYSNFIHKIRVDNSKIYPEYLFCFLKTIYNIKLTESMQSQTNGIRNLIMENYLNQSIVVPVDETGAINLEKQKEIAHKIQNIRSKAKKLKTNS